jgi:hypothetical protein
VTIDNEGANKVDAYLQMHTEYNVTQDPSSGATTATAAVRLTNNSPRAGLPAYVLGTPSPGTNTMRLVVFTALPVTAARLGGAPITMQFGTAFGWNYASTPLVIAPGSAAVLSLDVTGFIAPKPYRVVTRVQPLANPPTMHVTVNGVPLAEP